MKYKFHACLKFCCLRMGYKMSVVVYGKYTRALASVYFPYTTARDFLSHLDHMTLSAFHVIIQIHVLIRHFLFFYNKEASFDLDFVL